MADCSLLARQNHAISTTRTLQQVRVPQPQEPLQLPIKRYHSTHCTH